MDPRYSCSPLFYMNGQIADLSKPSPETEPKKRGRKRKQKNESPISNSPGNDENISPGDARIWDKHMFSSPNNTLNFQTDLNNFPGSFCSDSGTVMKHVASLDESASSVKVNSDTGLRMCAGCGEKIVDRFLLHAVDRYWHTTCLKCSCCQAPLGEIGSSCFTKSGLILCKNDYIRLRTSGGVCAACQEQIPASELVMRAQGNAYHVHCFACASCQCQLVPGDRFSVMNGSLVCEYDYPRVLSGDVQIQQHPHNNQQQQQQQPRFPNKVC